MDGAPSTANSSSQDGAKSSSMIQSKRDLFFSTYVTQDFALPDSIMYYIAKNPPSPEVYEKLIKSCKYFFVKNPILVVPDLSAYGGKEWSVGSTLLSKITSKVWLTGEFAASANPLANDSDQNIVSSLVPKLYRCDIKDLRLAYQVVSYDDLVRLISSAESIHFTNITVKDTDGTDMALEKIAEMAVKAKEITVTKPTVSSKTMKELVKIPHFANLDYLCMHDLLEVFDIESFYVYMKKNQQTSCCLRFFEPISDAYMARLEEIVDEILAAETLDYKPPSIFNTGLDFKKYQKLRQMYFFH